MNSSDPDPKSPNNCLAATLLSLILAAGFAFLTDVFTQLNALSITFGVLAAICVLSTLVLGIKTYTLYFPKSPDPPPQPPPDLVLENRQVDDFSAYAARNKNGTALKVRVHINLYGVFTKKDEIRNLLLSQLAVQRAINEYYLLHDEIIYAELDQYFVTAAEKILEDESIYYLSFTTVDIK